MTDTLNVLIPMIPFLALLFGLGLIITLIKRFLFSLIDSKYHYRLSVSLLSPQELKFYNILLTALKDKPIIICPKVRLEDILYVPKSVESHERWSERGRIKPRHVDFLLCDSNTLKPLLPIEFDGKSHEWKSSIEADDFKNKIFHDVGLDILRIKEESFYNLEDICKKISDRINTRTSLG